MNHLDEPKVAGEHPLLRRVRREALLASSLAFFGVLVLPALIFWVGVRMLGPYPGGASLGAFYGDFLRDLAATSGRAWYIALGPLLILTAARIALFAGAGRAVDAERPESHPPGRRREPRIEL